MTKYFTTRGVNALKSVEDIAAFWVNAKGKKFGELIEGNSVLEVGCGIGGITKCLAEQGHDITSFDPYKECVNLAKNRLKGKKNVKFFVGDINKLSRRILSKRYDSIVLCDVLEHIEDDVLTLKNCHKLLKDNGVLLLLIPAFQFLWGEEDRVDGHFRRYSKKELKNKLSRTGFKVDLMRYWNFPGMILWYAYDRLFKKSICEEKYLKNYSFLKKFGKHWMKLEDVIELPGCDILVKARKIS